MHTKKMWDTVMILMVLSFVCLVIYANIDTVNDKAAEDINSKKPAREAAAALESKDISKDKPIHMSISEPVLSEKELNGMADLIIIGQITDVTRVDVLEAKDASSKIVNLNIPYIIYDVSIIDSLKNPASMNNIKIKCLNRITYGYDPREVKQGDLYKFYLSINKDKSYSFVNYSNGMQRFTED